MTMSDSQRQHAGLLAAFKAVSASFFGVRGRKAHEQDFARLNPVHVILVGLALAAAFVLVLVMVVKSVVG